ncbi:hypothetical protein PtA15_18A10 [Puccinia triticina]|uniref:non-specific serine/threonine protein kinase n=1 Tax=Puccinia triticina TaxID=208348 RepID=A0ABY7D7T4_9BASI|nr:uncharacterized protein PtA15_18A10 [Puccinia triticina]WAQ92955.1 hypothetical protein PtA15_18A10 [Puccinia triticina]
MITTNDHSLSLSPPTTPPHRNTAALPQPQQPHPLRSASACTPSPSNHNTPLSQRYRSIARLSQPDRPAPSRSGSRNDIFALSLPQPTLPLPATQKPSSHPHHHEPTHDDRKPSAYDQRDLTRLKTSLHLRINTSPSAILGQGTHATVHLALLSIPPADTQTDHPKPSKLCAAKLSEDIAGSIKETLVLERLRDPERSQSTLPDSQANGSRFILGWFGLKDHEECEWIRSPGQDAKHRKQSSNHSFLPPIVLALEYCAGGDLFKFVQRAANLRPQDSSHKSLELGSQRWLRWSQELAQALAWCKQRNVLIGDLKPQNVLLTGDLRIKLSDFNRSTILSVEQTKDGLGLIDPQGTGTSVYAAPELVQPPPSPCSFPADIFALGVTMYFLLTGREPYRGVQSAVERMLLISRGAFWEHELGIRWRMLEEVQSAPMTRGPSSSSSKYPQPLSRSTSTDSHPSSQSTLLLVSHKTIDALYQFKPEPESNLRNPTLEHEETHPARDGETRIGFYSDGSPKIRYLNGNEIVDERIMKLIAKMCSPAAADRPQIEQVLEQLRSF